MTFGSVWHRHRDCGAAGAERLKYRISKVLVFKIFWILPSAKQPRQCLRLLCKKIIYSTSFWEIWYAKNKDFVMICRAQSSSFKRSPPTRLSTQTHEKCVYKIKFAQKLQGNYFILKNIPTLFGRAPSHY